MASLRFRHFINGSLVFVSIGTYLTKSCFAFSATLTNVAFDHSSLRWFGASTCMAVPRGLPSAPVKHSIRASGNPLLPWRTIISKPDDADALLHHVLVESIQVNVGQQR